ncbi:MAG: hypothetical protein KZQ93_01420 [Candidatus Thiodiazotropha sp. (ex Monitilora ramsayi)]|nr:hypothetical protein [Candidatus Thiodiazotropha sp. (ex Monitilora ramsayi)]
MSVLLGDLALVPNADATYEYLNPVRLDTKAPSFTLRFVKHDRFPDFINCDPEAPPVPGDFASYPEVKFGISSKKEEIKLEAEQPGREPDDWVRFLSLESLAGLPDKVEVERIRLKFRTGDDEGVYILRVDTGEQPVEPYYGAPSRPYIDYVFIYCKEQTTFSDDDPLVGKQIADGANLCRKNGWLWFVHPIYFAEQLMNIRLPKKVREDIAYCEDLPDDLPACDEELVRLQCGYRLAGMGRICVHVDVDVDECIKTEGMQVQVSDPIELTRLLREA